MEVSVFITFAPPEGGGMRVLYLGMFACMSNHVHNFKLYTGSGSYFYIKWMYKYGLVFLKDGLDPHHPQVKVSAF